MSATVTPTVPPTDQADDFGLTVEQSADVAGPSSASGLLFGYQLAEDTGYCIPETPTRPEMTRRRIEQRIGRLVIDESRDELDISWQQERLNAPCPAPAKQ